MNVTLSFLRPLCRCLGVLLQLLRYALSFCWALLLPRAVTAAYLLAIQSQLAVELNRSPGREKRHRQFSPAFRILWVVLSKFLDGWEELVHVMKPETVKRWHTRAFRAWWRWKSRAGRKPVALEIQQLIRRLSKENLVLSTNSSVPESALKAVSRAVDSRKYLHATTPQMKTAPAGAVSRSHMVGCLGLAGKPRGCQRCLIPT